MHCTLSCCVRLYIVCVYALQCHTNHYPPYLVRYSFRNLLSYIYRSYTSFWIKYCLKKEMHTRTFTHGNTDCASKCKCKMLNLLYVAHKLCFCLYFVCTSIPSAPPLHLFSNSHLLAVYTICSSCEWIDKTDFVITRLVAVLFFLACVLHAIVLHTSFRLLLLLFATNIQSQSQN